MDKNLAKDWIGRVAVVSRTVLGAAFLLASVDKVMGPVEFARVVESYKILPEIVISPFSIIVAWVEFIAGILLILGVASRGAAFTTFCLLMMFMVAIGVNLARGATLDCGCFGAVVSDEPLGWSTMLRDVVLAGLAVHVTLMDNGSSWLDRLLHRRRSNAPISDSG